ncbi:MAG: hypothetical protein PHQ86_00730 [Dehalococcoidales bacterium]|nr:hypothetical protein [Dehalococcoidales bacterium]
MRSKKALYIILIIDVLVFVVSLAIGRPLWQAIVFSIGFLLIAAVAVSGSSLLIPEGLLEGRFPRRNPPKAVGKAEFLEKMDLVLADLSVKPEIKTGQIYWMTEYTQVIKGVGDLVYDVHDSVKSKDNGKQLRAFNKAVKQLPPFINSFKNIPEIEDLKDSDTLERQAQGMDLYLIACASFIEAIEKSDGDLASDAAKQITKALDLLEIIEKPQAASW